MDNKCQETSSLCKTWFSHRINHFCHAIALAASMALAGCGGGGGGGGGNNTPTPDTIAPIANADNYNTAYNTPILNMNVTANDTDTNNAGTPMPKPVLTGKFIGPQTGGTFTVNGAGGVDFTPTNAFTGVASANYEEQDAAGNKAIGVVSVNVASPTVPTFSLWAVPIVWIAGNASVTLNPAGKTPAQIPLILTAQRASVLPWWVPSNNVVNVTLQDVMNGLVWWVSAVLDIHNNYTITVTGTAVDFLKTTFNGFLAVWDFVKIDAGWGNVTTFTVQ